MAEYRDDTVKEDRKTAAAHDKAADKARTDADKVRADAEKKADEGRKLVQERERLALEEKQKEDDARIKAERDKKEADAKEADRLSKMTAEERFAEVTPFAATVPSAPTYTEPHHATEFVLSEANGHRSRGNCYLADPAVVGVGTPLKKTAEATATQPPTYVLAAAGADCQALTLYAGGSLPGAGLRVSAIVRDAEVNGLAITWPAAFTDPEKAAGITALAAQGIIVRL